MSSWTGFTLAVGPAAGSDPSQEITEFSSGGVTASIDAGVDISFEVRSGSPEAQVISELDTDVWVYRLGVPFARGRIVSVVQTWTEDGGDSVSVTAVDYKRLLNARHVQTDLVYTGTPQERIVQSLIAHTQSQTGGDLGIVEGDIVESQARDRTYARGENIGQLLDNLTKVIDGPWFGVDADLRLNAFPFSSFPTMTTPITLGATARSLTRQSGAAMFANSVYVDGDNSSTVGVSVDAAGLASDPRGRWEKAAGFPNVVEQATLVEKADGLLESSASPVAQWSIVMEPERWLSDAGFNVGDHGSLVVPASTVAPIGAAATVKDVQVYGLSVSITADGEVGVSMEAVEV